MAPFEVGKCVQAQDTSGDWYAGKIEGTHYAGDVLWYYNIDIKQKWNKDKKTWENAPPEKSGVKRYFADKTEEMPRGPVAGFAT